MMISKRDKQLLYNLFSICLARPYLVGATNRIILDIFRHYRNIIFIADMSPEIRFKNRSGLLIQFVYLSKLELTIELKVQCISDIADPDNMCISIHRIEVEEW